MTNIWINPVRWGYFIWDCVDSQLEGSADSC